MKKIVLGLFVLISCFVLLFIGVNTRAISTPAMEDGAQIRTSGNQGIKFSATIDSLEGVTEHGFFVALGEHTKDAIAAAANSSANSVGGKKLKKIVVNGNELTFHGVVYNIPASSYAQDITALAYAYDGSSYTFASASVTRNILEVAQAAVSDPNYQTNVFIDRICNTSTFNLNGGEFTYDYSFVIPLSGDFGENVYGNGYYITCGKKANYSRCCNSFWSRIYINKTETQGLYQVIATGDEPANYDYVIGVHGNCYDTVSRSAIVGIISNFSNMNNYYVSFTEPTAKECNITVNVDRNIDKLGGNKIFYAKDEVLLTSVKKDYYNFAGWYDNSLLSGSPITSQPNNSSETYYAKWTPVQYTLSFDLQDGLCNGNDSLDDVTFTIESAVYNLPAANLMSKTDSTFLGWYDNASGTGEPITSIPAGSHGNKTVYAVWEADVAEELLLGANDIDIFEAEDIDIIVKAGLNGKYYVDLVKYDGIEFNTSGGTAFTTLAAALDYLNSENLTGKTIYVFSGTYSEAANVTKANTLILGPNYNVNGYAARNTEALITGLVTITGTDSTINGLDFTTDGAIKVGANNVTISYVKMTDVNTVTCDGNNRQGSIVDSASISNLTVKNSYIKAKGTSNSHTNQYMSFSHVSTFTMTDNYITNEATTLSASFAGMLIYNIGGVVTITGNTFEYSTNGYIFRLGGYGTNTATSITIQDNVFRGRDSYNNATIAIEKGTSSLTTSIIHNKFYNFAPDTYYFSGDTGSNIVIKYNYYDDQKNYQVATKGNAHITSDYNCYAGTIGGSDVSGANTQSHPVASLQSLDALYNLSLNATYSNISYDLNGGINEQNPISSYREGFDSDLLPTSPTKNGYLFLGWELVEGSGEYITRISYLQTGEVEVHAAWTENNVVELNVQQNYSANLSALNAITPDIIVVPGLAVGNYKLVNTLNDDFDSINYVSSINLFNTIADAISAASSGDIVYVFNGSYSETLTIDKTISLYGACYNLEMKHSDAFNESSSSQTILNNLLTVSGCSSVEIRGFVVKNQIIVNGVSGISISNIVCNSTTDGAIHFKTTASSNAVLDKIYEAGTSSRVVCFDIKVTNFTYQNSAVLDGATVNSSNNVDIIRFGKDSNNAYAYGNIIIRNSYFRAYQSGFMDRCPNTATSYTIENNYFKDIRVAIYFRSATVSITQNHTIRYNTIVNCGNNYNDWDVLNITNGTNTTTILNYNVFVDCDCGSTYNSTDKKTYTDYIIMIRNASKGTFDMSNNYFWNSSSESYADYYNAGTSTFTTYVIKNPSQSGTALSLWSLESATTTANTYDPYQVVEIGGHYYIYGINLTTSGS